jgi:uncharacterized protein
MSTPTLQRPVRPSAATSRRFRPTARWVPAAWAGFVVAALLLLDLVSLRTWGWVVPVAALALVAVTAPATRAVAWVRQRADRRDLAVMLGLYVVIVALYRLAFVVFTPDNVLGLFLSFGSGLTLGVVVPVVYTVWIRHRPLRSLGLGGHALRPTLALAGLFGGIQFAIMFWGYALPAPVDWVPLLVLSLTVGLFEAVFFRGFVQGRLEASFGTIPAVAGAAALYSLYHVGYGMGADEMLFLFGLGVMYAIAYRLTENILVLWPLLTPIGAFFNNLEGGDIVLPWAAILGFADVLGLMAAAVWLAARRERRATGKATLATFVDGCRQPRPGPR